MKRFLRWIGIAMVSVAEIAMLAIVAVYLLSTRAMRRTYEVPPVHVVIPTDSASVAEGRRLTTIRGCFGGCHGLQAEGGIMLDDPKLGRVVAPNLTTAVWFAIVATLAAGAVCGACFAWSDVLSIKNQTVRSWIQYNALYVGILVGLGIISLVMFEPVTTIPILLQSNDPPRALIAQALPVTALFTAGSAALRTVLDRPGWQGAGAIVLTAVLMVMALGLNSSILGLVAVPKTLLYVLAEVCALILTLALVYAGSMGFVWRHRFWRREQAT
jgi:hypothetical protein